MITILRWCVTTLPIVLALCVLYCIILRSVISIASFSGLQKKEFVHFVHHNYSFLSESWIINDNKQELMINKDVFEGPVGDYCIARNTIKCLFLKELWAFYKNIAHLAGASVFYGHISSFLYQQRRQPCLALKPPNWLMSIMSPGSSMSTYM